MRPVPFLEGVEVAMYVGRDTRGRIVVDIEPSTFVIASSGGKVKSREVLYPADAERLGGELLALAYDAESNRVAYAEDTDAAHDADVDDALADDFHPENSAPGTIRPDA